MHSTPIASLIHRHHLHSERKGQDRRRFKWDLLCGVRCLAVTIVPSLTSHHRYVYFEKVRILEGKKKTATRINNENTHPDGFSLENRRYGYYFVGR